MRYLGRYFINVAIILNDAQEEQMQLKHIINNFISCTRPRDCYHSHKNG